MRAIVIMDEPTASLDRTRGRAAASTSIARLRDDGVGIIYISHRLEEICGDRRSHHRAARWSRRSATRDAGDVTRADLIRHDGRARAGRRVPEAGRRRWRRGARARAICRIARSGVRDVSLTVRRGEILGVAGLVGSGRTELAETMFGLTPADAGADRGALAVRCRIAVARRRDSTSASPTSRGSTAARRRARDVGRGQHQPGQSAGVSRAWPDRSRTRKRAAAQRYVERLRIKTAVGRRRGRVAVGRQSAEGRAGAMAGDRTRRCCILDEPTQGVDVGAKAEIHAPDAGAGRTRHGDLMISSELPEILGMSDRIAVMRAGTIVANPRARRRATPGAHPGACAWR